MTQLKIIVSPNSIVNRFSDLFTVSNEVIASILIPLFVFFAGLVFQLLFKYVQKIKDRNVTKDILNLIYGDLETKLLSISENLLKNSKEYCLESKKIKPIFPNIIKSEINTLDKIGYERIYRSYFLGSNSWLYRTRYKAKLKALKEILNVTSYSNDVCERFAPESVDFFKRQNLFLDEFTSIVNGLIISHDAIMLKHINKKNEKEIVLILSKLTKIQQVYLKEKDEHRSEVVYKFYLKPGFEVLEDINMLNEEVIDLRRQFAIAVGHYNNLENNMDTQRNQLIGYSQYFKNKSKVLKEELKVLNT